MERSLLTTGEVAAALGVTSARVRQMVLSGLLQAEKAGRDVLIPIAEVDAAKQRKTKPGPKPKDQGDPAEVVTVGNESAKAVTTEAKLKRTRKAKAAKKAAVAAPKEAIITAEKRTTKAKGKK